MKLFVIVSALRGNRFYLANKLKIAIRIRIIPHSAPALHYAPRTARTSESFP
jgi:hypothetical protein